MALAVASSLSSTTVLLPRNPTQKPFCTGCGIGLSKGDYQKLIDQIDTSIDYNVPFDSKSAKLSGINTNSDGTPALACSLEDKHGDGTNDAGTISGSLLQSSLNALNQKVKEDQPACISLDGTYQYDLGAGANCAGDGGP